jgi:RHS repeat-associated protein
VNVVISDRKIWVTNAFKACNLSRTDYFPFGMLNDTWFSGTESLSGINPDWSFSGISGEISSRTSNSDNYRFGYNCMESDDETKGSGNSYTTEFRQYDPRIGRWLSLDPVFQPHQSPFCGMDNNPIFYSDPKGDYVIWGDSRGNGDFAPSKKDKRYIMLQLYLMRINLHSSVRKVGKEILKGDRAVYIAVHKGKDFETSPGKYDFSTVNHTDVAYEKRMNELIQLENMLEDECKCSLYSEGSEQYFKILDDQRQKIEEFKNGQYVPGLGADVVIDFVWDDFYFKNSFSIVRVQKNSNRQNRKILFTHEIKHAFNIMTGTSRKNIIEEERDASQFANKASLFDYNRKFYTYDRGGSQNGLKILINVGRKASRKNDLPDNWDHRDGSDGCKEPKNSG